jgi:acetyl esterase/lipase
MKLRFFALCIIFMFGDLRAQTNVWQPSSGHTQVLIWPGAVPDAQPIAAPESETTTTDMVAGKPVVEVDNVSHPMMTVYSPKGMNTGVAVVVFPGGGYKCLAIDLEGTEVCDWLTSKGTTCVLLKYRVPAPRLTPSHGAYPESPMALEDAQRTMGLVRFHAAEWHIDPHKIGVLGFSAGGHLVAAISTHFKKRLYTSVDAADKESCRPDFAVALYPGHLWIDDQKFELNPNVPVTRQTPPTFFAAGGRRPRGQHQPLAGLLHCAEKRRGSCGDAFVRARRACVRTAPHEVSRHGMASVSGDLAGDDRNDSGMSRF